MKNIPLQFLWDSCLSDTRRAEHELDNNHAHQLGATLNYSLSKRSMVYAEGVYQKASAGSHAAINGIMGPNGSSSTASQAIARVGLRTAF